MSTILLSKTQDFNPTADDMMWTVNDPGGTPADRKVAASDVITKAHGLSSGIVKIDGGNVMAIASAGSDFVSGSSSNTLTNKTFDTAGTGNVLKINGTAITDKTGTGKAVLDTAPTISAPVITGHATVEGVVATGATGTGKVVYDGSPVLITPNLGTPSVLLLTNATSLPAAGIGSGVIATARLGSGTANVNTAPRGDGTWGKTPTVVYVDSNNTTVASNNGTLTTLFAAAPSILAGTLAAGDAFILDAGMICNSFGATATCTYTLLYGATTLFTFTTPTMANSTNLFHYVFHALIVFEAIGSPSTIKTTASAWTGAQSAASATAQNPVLADSFTNTFRTTLGAATGSNQTLDLQTSLSANGAAIGSTLQGCTILKVAA